MSSQKNCLTCVDSNVGWLEGACVSCVCALEVRGGWVGRDIPKKTPVALSPPLVAVVALPRKRGVRTNAAA